MKKNIVLIGLLLFVFTSQLQAQGSMYRSGNVVRISETDSINQQLFATGEIIEMYGWLGNDFVSASESLTLDGDVMDDAIIAGSDLNIRGRIHDLLAAAGETITIDGEIYGDVFAAGATVRVTENAVIKGNANLAGQRVLVEGGTIQGVLKATGGELDLNGTVEQKTEIYGYNINFGPEYMAASGTDIYSDRTIYPENLGNLPEDLYINVKEPNIVELMFLKTALYLSLFITGVLLIRIFKQTSRDLYKFSTERFWKNTGIGFLTFLIYPLGIAVLAILLLTLPISFLLLLLYGLLLLTGYLLVALVIGVSSLRFLKKEENNISYYWGLFIGMILVAIIVNLPFLGWLFHAIFICFGLGSLILYFWNMRNVTQTEVAT